MENDIIRKPFASIRRMDCVLSVSGFGVFSKIKLMISKDRPPINERMDSIVAGDTSLSAFFACTFPKAKKAVPATMSPSPRFRLKWPL